MRNRCCQPGHCVTYLRNFVSLVHETKMSQFATCVWSQNHSTNCLLIVCLVFRIFVLPVKPLDWVCELIQWWLCADDISTVCSQVTPSRLGSQIPQDWTQDAVTEDRLNHCLPVTFEPALTVTIIVILSKCRSRFQLPYSPALCHSAEDQFQYKSENYFGSHHRFIGTFGKLFTFFLKKD